MSGAGQFTREAARDVRYPFRCEGTYLHRETDTSRRCGYEASATIVVDGALLGVCDRCGSKARAADERRQRRVS